MIHVAMKAPTWEKVQFSWSCRKMGRPTTNQTSREAKRAALAMERRLMAELLEKSWENLTLVFIFPKSPRMVMRERMRVSAMSVVRV